MLKMKDQTLEMLKKNYYECYIFNFFFGFRSYNTLELGVKRVRLNIHVD